MKRMTTIYTANIWTLSIFLGNKKLRLPPLPVVLSEYNLERLYALASDEAREMLAAVTLSQPDTAG